jgi:hypothetical protein
LTQVVETRNVQWFPNLIDFYSLFPSCNSLFCSAESKICLAVFQLRQSRDSASEVVYYRLQNRKWSTVNKITSSTLTPTFHLMPYRELFAHYFLCTLL